MSISRSTWKDRTESDVGFILKHLCLKPGDQVIMEGWQVDADGSCGYTTFAFELKRGQRSATVLIPIARPQPSLSQMRKQR